MKILILGGGPGGYVAAIRAAQLGADVTIVEKRYFGGTCLNVGCIPTKVLLNTTDLYHTLVKDGESLGILAKEIKIDWNRLQKRKATIVNSLVGGILSILDSNQIKMILGEGKFISKNQLEVIKENGNKQRLEFDYAIIATGSEPTMVPIEGVKLPGIMTSDELLSLAELPKSLCIVGGGVIGSEFASLFSRLGVKVTIVEMLPRIVDTMDEDIVGYLDYELRNQGVNILTRTKVEHFVKSGDSIGVCVSTLDGEKTIEAEKVLLSIGRRPVVHGVGLDEIGVLNDRGIKVNANMQTNIRNIYAIGDCTGGVMLAHVASAQGIMAAEIIVKGKSKMDFKTIPYCVYTKPELASVGMTEKQIKEMGYDYKVGRFPLLASGKALILGETEGIVKYIVDSKTEEVLALHIAGPKATELIVEGALALRIEATVDELISTIHAHPTVGESLQEAAHDIHQAAIHLPK